MKIANLLDIHTHHPHRPEALLSLPPQEALSGCDTPFSLELHPWHLTSTPQGGDSPEGKELCRAFKGGNLCRSFEEAAQTLQGHPWLLAIGECGLDNKCGVPLAEQVEAFRLALRTARQMHLPVILHGVGYWAELTQCCQEEGMLASNCPPLIVHGFRKGPQLAQQLLDAGFHLSLGEKFNPEVARIVPTSRLWFETDESQEDIEKIRKRILELREVTGT